MMIYDTLKAIGFIFGSAICAGVIGWTIESLERKIIKYIRSKRK